MIHYHGLPINPQTAGTTAVCGGHAFITAVDPHPLGMAVAVCQSFAIDNGAFSAWRSGRPIKDWSSFYQWAAMCKRIPACDFAVVPDVIDGSEADNDALLHEWPLPKWFGAPVWHMHESLKRLERMLADWPRICIGSSAEFSTIGTDAWWKQMHRAMRVVCNADGEPLVRLHGLRMLNPKIFTKLPFASADSTNIARNIGIDKRWTGSYPPPTKESRALILRQRIESKNSTARWSDPDNDLFVEDLFA